MYIIYFVKFLQREEVPTSNKLIKYNKEHKYTNLYILPCRHYYHLTKNKIHRRPTSLISTYKNQARRKTQLQRIRRISYEHNLHCPKIFSSSQILNQNTNKTNHTYIYMQFLNHWQQYTILRYYMNVLSIVTYCIIYR